MLAALAAPPAGAAGAQVDSVKELGTSGAVHFVVVSTPVAKSDDGLRRVARNICDGASVCAVRFWLNETQAARRLPMSDEQASHEYASYAVNRNTGLDGFTCKPGPDRVPPCIQSP
jgi:hypothetical protein